MNDQSSAPRTLDTLDSLRAVLDRPQVQLPVMTARKYADLDAAGRSEYNDLRQEYMARTTLETPAMGRAFKVTRRLLHVNRSRDYGRRSLGLTGHATTGKTTAALAIARRVESTARKNNPGYREHGVVPVAMVNVPPGCTSKALLHTILQFYVPWTYRRTTTDELLETTCNIVRERRTDMLILDEFHNLRPRSSSGAEAADLIKTLQNKMPCTFVFAGIDLTSTHALGSEAGRQIRARTDMVELAAGSLSTAGGRAAWVELVKRFDNSLPLIGHKPGLVTKKALALHDATGGHIGGLAKILHDVTTDIILEQYAQEEPKERLTDTLLKEAMYAHQSASQTPKAFIPAGRKSA